jgi:hypothetical protein
VTAPQTVTSRRAVALVLAALLITGVTTQAALSGSPEPSRAMEMSSAMLASDGSPVTLLHGEVNREVVPIRDMPGRSSTRPSPPRTSASGPTARST